MKDQSPTPGASKRILFLLLLLTCARGTSWAQSKPQEVTFPSDGRELHGFFGSLKAPALVGLQEDEVDDVIAGLTYLKSQPFVDPNRVAISGCSYGGIQTLLIGERDLGIKALVPFAPGAMSWDRNLPLRSLLLHAVDAAKAPVFLIQAKNDYNLAPTEAQSTEARRKHKDFQSKIYPAFGSTHQDGHWRFCSSATDVWGNDVLAFLEAQMGGAPMQRHQTISRPPLLNLG